MIKACLSLSISLSFAPLPLGVFALTAVSRLKAYTFVHLEEEIRREALVKDWGAFVRFLQGARQISSGAPLLLHKCGSEEFCAAPLPATGGGRVRADVELLEQFARSRHLATDGQGASPTASIACEAAGLVPAPDQELALSVVSLPAEGLPGRPTAELPLLFALCRFASLLFGS